MGAERRSTLEILYQRYRHELCQYLRANYGEGPPEPEDVVQAAFAKFAEHPTSHTIENPRAFLYRVARNILIDQHRRDVTRNKFTTQEKSLAPAQISAASEPENVLINEQACSVLETALRQLDQRQRDFLLLHHLHNLSYTEIARRAGMSRNGVKAIIKQAFAKCEQAVAQAQEPEGHSGEELS